MGRTTSIVLLLIGMLLLLGSCAPFGYALYYEAVVDSSQSHSLGDVGTANQVTFHSTPGSLARLAIEAHVMTNSVQEDPDDFSDDFIARFKFPVNYSISDVNGNTLIKENAALAWKNGGSLSKRNEDTTSTGGTLTATTRFDKFTVPADGKLNIEIEVGPDSTYEATAPSLELHLYEGMIDNIWYVVAGITMLVIGIIMALIGFIFVVTNATKESNQLQISQPNAVSGTRQGSLDANQQAMFIQLSAFSGYIIPFGSIIVPVILWQIWKDKDPYVDRMGRESVNFQLSMALYYIICFILMFVIIGMVLIFFVMMFHFIFIIIGAVQMSRGIDYRHPMIIRFIKS
ncbi:MAG: DUF4870 domain-containing protein [Proteobacteria bacterium]|nr:DUF4870 domain-containing protein [Pseudomonadota bacterium]NOG60042.1 DUF4870 domain-containing protein [Pseudomonadota bacterium]